MRKRSSRSRWIFYGVVAAVTLAVVSVVNAVYQISILSSQQRHRGATHTNLDSELSLFAIDEFAPFHFNFSVYSALTRDPLFHLQVPLEQRVSREHVFNYLMATTEASLRDDNIRFVTMYGDSITGEWDLHGNLLIVVPGNRPFYWPARPEGSEQKFSLLGSFGKLTVKTISETKPRVLAIPNFLTRTECAAMQSRSAKYLKPAHLQWTGNLETMIKNNYITPVDFDTDDKEFNSFILRIQMRVSELMLLPTAHLENFIVDRFEAGQYARAHYAHLMENLDPESPRFQPTEDTRDVRLAMLTVVLRAPYKGGEIIFPYTSDAHSLPDVTACPNRIKVTPEAGTAYLLYTTLEEGSLYGWMDRRAMQGVCTVESGELWTLTIPIHNAPQF